MKAECKSDSTNVQQFTLPTILKRERLFSWLESHREKPIIAISAPAGSGKTTLVASYLETRHIPCIWYQMDRSDADISNFFCCLETIASQQQHKKKIFVVIR